VCLPVIKVEVQRAILGEQSPGLKEARLEECPVVIELVVVSTKLTASAVVGRATVAGDERGGGRSILFAHSNVTELTATLYPPGIKGRIKVHEGEVFVGQLRQDREIITQDDSVSFGHGHTPSLAARVTHRIPTRENSAWGEAHPSQMHTVLPGGYVAVIFVLGFALAHTVLPGGCARVGCLPGITATESVTRS